MLLIAMRGLPGTGKTTLARALAGALDAIVLSKDELRAALFGPDDVDYSRAQDDFCCRLLYDTVGWLAARGRRSVAIVDGRTFTRRAAVDELLAAARRLDLPLRWIECRCAADVARERLTHDAAAGAHPAGDRDALLHDRVAATVEVRSADLAAPCLVVHTDAGTTEEHVAACVDWLGGAGAP